MLTAILRETLIVPSPGAMRPRLLRLAMYRRKGRLPKGERRIVRAYINKPEFVALPRGLAPKVRAMVPTRLLDLRLLLPPVDFAWRGQLRPEQSQAAWKLYRAGGGILLSPPGSGKTETGLAVVAAFRQPALWLVHTKPLAEQAMSRARRLFNLPWGAVGYVGEGQEDWGTHLTVGMIQSFSKKRMPGAAQRVGTVVVDEAHHTPAITMTRVVSMFPARYRLGLTATLDRGDDLGPLAVDLMGPTVVPISQQDLLEQGRIVLPTVYVYPTRFTYWGSGDWSDLQRARARDLQRNTLLCELAAQEFRKGRRVIVLVELRPHAKLLAQALVKRWRVPAVPLTGLTPKVARNRTFREVQKGRLVAVCTKLIDEGVDVPAVDCLILGSPGRSALRLKQQVGRTMRAWEGKADARILDLADPLVPSLAQQLRERLRVYRAAPPDGLGLKVVQHGWTQREAPRGGSMA